MFAEAMAVNYYELDLANASQRYVLQELLHIAVFEEGENIVQLQYQGCDYKMPASWINEVPRTGNISLFYARTKDVIKEVMEKGSCDARKHANPLHHEKYFPPNGPQWKETWDLGGQAAGLQWIDAYKIRLVKSKIQETAAMDPVDAFRIFDDDGSGEMDRKEIVQVEKRGGGGIYGEEGKYFSHVMK